MELGSGEYTNVGSEADAYPEVDADGSGGYAPSEEPGSIGPLDDGKSGEPKLLANDADG